VQVRKRAKPGLQETLVMFNVQVQPPSASVGVGKRGVREGATVLVVAVERCM